MSEYMKNEILEFLNRHNGGKTAEIAEALAVTDYQARYYRKRQRSTVLTLIYW
jgi:predicted ArsR family transcriptional regulator